MELKCLSSDKVITSSVDVHFYKYECQLGDYLFADGTYGHELGDSEVSPVGVVFYLEPIYRRYALAVALNEGKTLPEAVKFANKASTISVTRLGAQSSAPYRREIID